VRAIETFEEYLETIDDDLQKDRMAEILNWIKKEYPDLDTRIAWNEPMFTNEGTFITGFSYSKNHIAMSPEMKPIQIFKKEIKDNLLDSTDHIIRIKWSDPIPYELIKELIDYNIDDKAGYTKFWR
jgi:hypothetical protein